MPLFEAVDDAPAPHPLEARLAHVDPDALTPREAQALIYELKSLSARDAKG